MIGRLFVMAASAGVVLIGAAPPAKGEPVSPTVDHDAGDTVEEPERPAPVSRAAADGEFLPLTLTARVGATAAVAASYGGYDSARGAVMESYGEVTLWGPLALRGTAGIGDGTHRLRPSVAGRVQVLSQRRHGVDGALSIAYRAEGFTEAEGEIETVLALSRTIRGATAIVNLAYGQDPEGRERDGEVRAAVLGAVSRRVQLGVDGRWRFDLGSDEAVLRAGHELAADVDVGPVAAIALGPLAVTAHGGGSVVRPVNGGYRVGLVALAGLGTAF